MRYYVKLLDIISRSGTRALLAALLHVASSSAQAPAPAEAGSARPARGTGAPAPTATPGEGTASPVPSAQLAEPQAAPVPVGQQSPAQVPSGQYPAGQYPPGQYPPIQQQPGQYPPGQYPPGHYAPVQYTPPLPPAAIDDPEHHNHDGFYLRMSLPIGWQATRFDFDGTTARRDFTVAGPALGLELRLGGTPWAGLAIGVQIYNSSAHKEDIYIPNDTEPGEEAMADDHSRVIARTALFGFFVDYFPDPRGNFHLGGSVGISNNRIEHDGDGDSDLDDAAGLGASAWAGYGWWISKNWSIGGMGQVTGSFGDSVSNAMSARTLAVVAMFSLLYH